ncbi:MAG: S9 family peptidase [Bacteroidetes bacterium]|nr:S9 family peptidase [Bacteroidota bacterium]MBU1718246.1 S9 family peptidase [Bacteroidota bacterium]
MKRFYVFALAFFWVIASPEAQVKELKISDFLSNYELYPEMLDDFQWLPGKDVVVYVNDGTLFSIKATGGKTTELLTLETLNEAYKASQGKDLRAFPDPRWIDENTFWFSQKNKIFKYQLKEKKLTLIAEYKEDVENADIHPKTFNIACTEKNNLFISSKGKMIQVTNEENPDIVCGKSVHRVEWGIEKGTFWSPTGAKLAFYRMDESMVTGYPLVHVDGVKDRIAEVEYTKYPMTGMTSHNVTVGVYEMATAKTVWLQTGEPSDQFLTCVTWGPNGKNIYLAVLNREQNRMKLNKYDALSGKFVATLFEESSDKWVEPQHSLLFHPVNKEQFIWRTKKDGWDHLYLYDTKGKLISQLTKGEWDVAEVTGFSADGTQLFFTAARESAVEEHGYVVNVATGVITKLSNAEGTHSIAFNTSGKYIIDTYSSVEVPGKYEIIDIKGKTTCTVFASANHSASYNFGKTKIFTIKAKDGTDLYCRLITPPEFDEKKKYPVFYYVYGGPHSQLITNSWQGGSGLFLQYMASKGYIVFTLDNRGTSHRGLAFEQAIFRNLGSIEVDDQMAGVEWLKSKPWVDKEKLGIQGWSYGGFITLSMILKHPGIFKAAVAGGPVIDWKFYEVMYGERYMDTPDENPDGYKNASLLNYVDSLDAKLLIIQGAIDPTVPWQNSMMFVKTCVEKGKQLDFFVYPEHEHNVRGKDRLHLYTMIERYIKDNLNLSY